jgi:hypothetical protein
MELNRRPIKKCPEHPWKIVSSLEESQKQWKLSGANKSLRPNTHLVSVFRELFEVNSVRGRPPVFQNR